MVATYYTGGPSSMTERPRYTRLMPSSQHHQDSKPVPVGTNGSWTIAAVYVMTVGVQILAVALNTASERELAPVYTATYLLVGLCIFVPTGKPPSLGQVMAFLVPGLLLVGLWFLGGGLWCGLWLLGTPAWGLLCHGWKDYGRQEKKSKMLLFLPIFVGASTIFVVSSFYFNPAAFVAPLIPLLSLARSDRPSSLQFSVEMLLSLVVVSVALLQPEPPGTWSSPYNYAGGALSAGLLMAWWANRNRTAFKEPILPS